MNIDINCDMGEILSMVEDGSQEALMPFLTSANIACGGHAGDEHSMKATVEQAHRWKLRIGAHPGYPDRENFGRLPIDMPFDAVSDFIFEQVKALAEITSQFGGELRHVKPHGALYNSAVNNEPLSEAIARGAARWSQELILMGLAGSRMLEVFQAEGFAVEAEAFADRRYEADGSLRSRKHSDSLITDPNEAASQAHDIAQARFVTAVDGSKITLEARTICIHGDTPGALEIAAAVKHRLSFL